MFSTGLYGQKFSFNLWTNEGIKLIRGVVKFMAVNIQRFKVPIKYMALLVVVVAAYFINRQVQAHFGEVAIEQTGLTMYPLQQAIEKAKVEGKMVFADMSAIWCPTCRKLDQVVFSDERVKSVLSKHYVFSRIDYESDEGEAFMQRYQVSGFPTLLVLDGQGNKLGQVSLTFSPEKFIDMITPQQ